MRADSTMFLTDLVRYLYISLTVGVTTRSFPFRFALTSHKGGRSLLDLCSRAKNVAMLEIMHVVMALKMHFSQ